MQPDAMPKDQGMWNAIFALIFFGVFGILFWSLTDGLDRFDWLFLVDTMDIVIISLATFRMIRLTSSDKMFAFVRNSFLDKQEDGMYQKPPGGPRRTVAELVECLWCTGLWGALFVSVVYFAADIGRFFVILLAVAAVGSFLQLLSQMVARIGR